MVGRKAAGELRWLVLPQHRLHILKYSGELDGSAITGRLSDFFRAHPEAGAYAALNDLRGFVGSIG